jgi:phosphatidylserine decarboxylase
MCGHRDEESINSLLAGVGARGNKLFYAVIYLSPGDYHRFHSPALHTALTRRHIAGYLSPVKPSYVKKHKDVFKANERVNVFGEWNKN